MRIARSIMLAIAATLGASGCRAWNPGSLTPTPTPRPKAEVQRAFDVDAFVAEHNRNAELIETLEAKLSIGIHSKIIRRPNGLGADGRLAMERPRNFKLELLSMGNSKADIGSNDQEFWFWVQNDENKIYWCNYDEVQSSSLTVVYQPDWIIEALGLKTISDEEADKIKIGSSDVKGTTALVFPPTKNGAETSSRMMIVWNHNRRVKEHRIYQGSVPSPKSLLAQADVSRFAEFIAGNDDSEEPKKCYLPETLRLDWKQDQLALDVQLKKDPDGMYAVKVNQFDSSRSAALFTEPPIRGAVRVNLAEINHSPSADSRTTVRQTIPPPPTRNGGRLGRPAAEPAEDHTTMKPTRRPRRPPTEDDSTTSPLEGLVGASTPVGLGSFTPQSAAASSPRDALNQVDR